MSKKKITVMLTVLLITILSASCFYVIEKGIDPLSIFVNSYAAEDSSNDFEKVYGDSNAPYTDDDGKPYFIRYTGKQTKSTTVDLTKTNESISINPDGYPVILGTTITNTYKMFTKSSSLKTYADVETVFLPSSVAIKSNGIKDNTFAGCTQEIDFIYKTGDIANKDMRGSVLTSEYDRTDIIKQNNVTTYVCLNNENIADRGNVDTKTVRYAGEIKNVYISSDVVNIGRMFSKVGSNYEISKDISNILLDKNGQWTSLYSLIDMQEGVKKISSHFVIPETVTDLENTFRWTGIQRLSDGFTIPDKVTTMLDMFGRCYNLEYIPDSFVLPKSLENAQGIFFMCTSLKEFPSEFVIPENVTDMKSIFMYDYYLSTTVIIKSKTANMDEGSTYPSFEDAGTSNDLKNIDGYNTPIVMECYSDSVAASYTTNVYSSTNLNGKVTKEIVDGEWSKVYDNDGPYGNDEKYYIHYVGKSSDKANSVSLDLSDTTKYVLDSNGYPKILGTSITNTYKMFSYNDKVKQVIIPGSIAIKSKGIKDNTFEGCTQEIDFIYKTGNIANKDTRGSVLTSEYDKTDIIKQNNVTTYVCLNNENIADRSDVDTYTVRYAGEIKNVYISSDVVNIGRMFSKVGSNYEISKDISNILLDKNGRWTSLYSLIDMQEGVKKISSHFVIPETVTDLENAFRYTGLQRLPDGFTIPDKVTTMMDMFGRCYNLEYVPDSFVLPKNLENAQGIFFKCLSLKEFPKEFVIPESVTEMKSIFMDDSYLSTTVIIKSKNANMDEGSTYPSFKDAGTSNDLKNIDGYNTPIVMKCYSDSVAASYATNVYSSANTDGKVTKEIIDGEWSKVYDNDGPYGNDEKYYIHYVGKSGDKANSVSLDLSDTTKYPLDNNGYPRILETSITNTYKMFSYNNKVYQVIIPGSIAIKSKGIKDNTFVGCTQEIDFIYKTGNIDNKDTRGSVLTSEYDKTDIIKQNNVTTYVCLNNENMADRSNVNTTATRYTGEIKNVYISSDVVNIGRMFSKVGSNYEISKDINNILLDKNGQWTSLYSLIDMQEGVKKISSHFVIPETVTDLENTFRWTGIQRLPDGFTIPDKVTTMLDMFGRCYNLEYIPDSFVLPKSLENAQGIFFMCTSLKEFSKEFVIPENVTEMKSIFMYDYYLSTTVIIKSKTANMDEGSTYPTFKDAGTARELANLPGYNTPIIMKCYSDSVAASYTTNVYSSDNPDGRVTKEYLDVTTNTVQEIEKTVTVDENTQEETVDVSTSDNKTSGTQPIVIEDETNLITITVNKKSVDETVDDIQTSSQSVKSVESENKEEGEIEE